MAGFDREDDGADRDPPREGSAGRRWGRRGSRRDLSRERNLEDLEAIAEVERLEVRRALENRETLEEGTVEPPARRVRGFGPPEVLPPEVPPSRAPEALSSSAAAETQGEPPSAREHDADASSAPDPAEEGSTSRAASDEDLPRWTEPELVWPLALGTGFVATWIGVATGVPGVAAVLAGLAFAPLFAGLLNRGLGLRAALSTLGWMGGVAVAVAGLALEDGVPRVVRTLPFAHAWYRQRLADAVASWGPGGFDGSGAGGAGALGEPLDARSLGFAALALAAPALLAGLARLGAPILSLLGLALGAGAVAGGVAGPAAGLVGAGYHPFLAILLACPPHSLAVLAAGALWTTAAVSRRPWEPDTGAGGRMALAGAGLAVVGALGEALGHGAWAQWLESLGNA